MRALAAVYGLEPRACGRRGQTLFRTDRAGLPSADGLAQVHAQALCCCSPSLPHLNLTRRFSLEKIGHVAVERCFDRLTIELVTVKLMRRQSCLQVGRLLACSFQGGKPSTTAKLEMEAALQIGRASLKRPIAATNKGSILLRQMGWSEGFGLGSKEQGRTEPIPLHVGQRRRGLGSR